MAKQDGNYGMLLKLRNELTHACQSNLFRLFNKDKIERFSKYNAIRLQAADEKIDRLIKRFVMHDEEGCPMQETGSDNRVVWLYNNPEDQKAFEIEYTEFINRAIVIEC